MRGITRDTFVELVDRKFLWLFGVVTVVTCVIVALTSKADIRIDVQSTSPLTGDKQMQTMLGSIMLRMIENFASFMVFLTVMATAGLLPRMLEKGRADFYFSKPISRTGLLYSKLCSIWLVYGVLITVCTGILSLTAQISFGSPGLGVLYIIGESLVLLFIWLSIIGFAGVWSSSTVMSIVAAFIVYILQLLLPLRVTLYSVVSAKWLKVILDGAYYILPKPSQIGDIMRTVVGGDPVATWMPLWSSLLFALAAYFAAAVIIRRRDY